MKPFDIIVPVYGAFHDARAAMESVLAAQSLADFRLIVIDDASPENFTAFAGDLATHPKVEIVRNSGNLGFSGTVNRGMAMHPDRDVVLLNSDAIVFGDWLDRLSRILREDPAVGTITPMSNAATILSYPLDCADNADALETDWREIDEICARIDADPVEIPTAVGFCMTIRRACLAQVGPFDAARFGRGYGEENDFCMRALARGWKNVAACNVFSWHRGASSFKGERESLAARAQDLLRELHPHYPGMVGDFLRRSPLAPLRAEIDARRARGSGGGFLIVGDAAGADETAALHLRRDGRKRWRLAFASGAPLPNLRPFVADEPPASIRQQLVRLGVSRLRFARDAAAPHALRDVAASLGLPIEIA